MNHFEHDLTILSLVTVPQIKELRDETFLKQIFIKCFEILKLDQEKYTLVKAKLFQAFSLIL